MNESSILRLVDLNALNKTEWIYMIKKVFSENDELMVIPYWECNYGRKYIIAIVSGFSSRFTIFVRVRIPVYIVNPFFDGLDIEGSKEIDNLVEELRKMGYKADRGPECVYRFI